LEQNEIRNQVQELGAKYGCENKRIIVELPTSSGKGRLCMMILDRAPTDRKWLVIVPELIQIENLKRDIEKHGFTHLYDDKIEDIVCYASMHKYRGAKLNVWMNECHRLSELKEDIAQSLDHERIIADSATIPLNIKTRLYGLGEFFEYKLTLQEAVDMGLLPEPAIYVKKIVLERERKREYDIIERKLLYLIDRAEEEGKHPMILNQIKQLGSQRKKFLAESKTDVARDLMMSLGEKKTLCYTGSVEQCNELGGELAVNSKKTKKHNLRVIDRFNSYEVSQVYMNRMGREGLNLEGIQAVVIVQLSAGNDEGLDFVQRVGRGLRSSDPEIYLLVVQDTADEKFLYRALLNIDKRKIHYIK